MPAGGTSGEDVMIGYVTIGSNDLEKARNFYTI